MLLFCRLAHASGETQQQLSQIFVGRSFTIRNFYRGGHLRYGSDGQLAEKAEPGFWSRDGMVEFTSVKLSGEALRMQGVRACIQFEPKYGEFVNVKTGDKVEIEVQLRPDQLTPEALIPLLQKILLNSRDHLADLVPSYWANCLSRRVTRTDKHSPWECETADITNVPDFAGKKVSWDVPPPDTSIHDGTRQYLMRHRAAYLVEDGMQTPPQLRVASDPYFDWFQRRTPVGNLLLVLALTVGEDGSPQHIFIVSPVGGGIDDEAAEAVARWHFKPAVCGDKPCKAHARVYFEFGGG